MGDERKKRFSLTNCFGRPSPLTHTSKRSACAYPGLFKEFLVTFRGMVQHNDKWKKKATREYHRKHGTLPVGRGRGRGRGRGCAQTGELPEQSPQPDETTAIEEGVEAEAEESAEGSNDEAGGHEAEQSRKERSSKYARRTIESNAWRFESEQPDPYLSTQSPPYILTHH